MFLLVSEVLTFRLCSWVRKGCSCAHSVLCENTPMLARSVIVLHGHRLHRDNAVVLIASVAIFEKLVCLSYFILKLETEDH